MACLYARFRFRMHLNIACQPGWIGRSNSYSFCSVYIFCTTVSAPTIRHRDEGDKYATGVPRSRKLEVGITSLLEHGM